MYVAERKFEKPRFLKIELEVLTLLASGLGNRRTARFLKLTEAEVRARLSSIRTKMRVRSNAEAVMKALRENRLEVHRASDVGVSQLIPAEAHAVAAASLNQRQS